MSSDRPLLPRCPVLPQRVFLPGVLLLFSCLICLPPASAANAVSAARHRRDAARPLIAIFPLKSAAEPAKDTKEEKKKEDEAVAENLLMAAAKGAKDLLTESGVADAIIYAPDSPVFARAIQESKLSVSDSMSVQTPAERIALGKAVGAVYALSVEARRGEADKGGGVEIAMRAHETASGKEWSDRVRMSQGASVLRPGIGGPSPQNALLSAVNTLIARFLAGPLREFSRNATPPSLIPPRPITPGGNGPSSSGETTGVPGEDTEALAENARRHGEALISSGDMVGAMMVLRRAVNLSPRSLALRGALTRAYLAARQYTEASAEARRALMVASSEDRNGRIEMTRLLAQALSATGDMSAARLTYEQIIAAEPRAAWARIALGDLHLRAGRVDEAEEQYRTVRHNAPDDADAALGLARVQAARGDYPGAVKELTEKNADPATRYAVAREVFDDGAIRLAALLEQNRKAFEEGQIAREAFHKATTLQSDRVSALLNLLRSVPPPPGDAVAEKTHRQRILAASLLAQTLASVLSFIEEGDENGRTQASLLLMEFRKEIARARAAAAGPPETLTAPPGPI